MGFVDDYMGITEANHQAQQMNIIFNVRSAEKSLQFGEKKCKKMYVGKDKDIDLSGTLTVDKWSTKYTVDSLTGEDKLQETYEGTVEMEEVKEWLYLGFIISNRGNNLANLKNVKIKAIITKRNIINRLECLNLQTYYYECGILFCKVMLRPSILYGCETYYNLTEN